MTFNKCIKSPYEYQVSILFSTQHLSLLLSSLSKYFKPLSILTTSATKDATSDVIESKTKTPEKPDQKKTAQTRKYLQTPRSQKWRIRISRFHSEINFYSNVFYVRVFTRFGCGWWVKGWNPFLFSLLSFSKWGHLLLLETYFGKEYSYYYKSVSEIFTSTTR